MTTLSNPGVSRWGRIYSIEFLIPDPQAGSRFKSYISGKTRGPEGDNSVVHSIRPDMSTGRLLFYIYYTLFGEPEEILWEIVDLPFRLKFDVRDSLSGK